MFVFGTSTPGRAAKICGLASALALVAPAAAQATTLHCGDTVTQNVTLANDLTGCTGDGIDIGADGLTIRLNGHRISGAPQTRGMVGINFNGHRKVKLMGGPGTAIEAFLTGVLVDGDSNTLQQILTRLDTRDNGTQAAVDIEGNYNRLTDSVQADNPAIGLELAGTGNTVMHDVAKRNGAVSGPSVEVGGTRNVLTHSQIFGRQTQDLVDVGGLETTVSYNRIDSETASPMGSRVGITALGFGGTIRANTITRSYIGLWLRNANCACQLTVVDNQAIHNGISYYDVGGAGNTLIGNRAQASSVGFWLNGVGGEKLENNVAGSIGSTSAGGGGNGVGIAITGGSDGVVLSANNASNNLNQTTGHCAGAPFPCDGTGILVDGATNTTLTNNTTNFNAGDGMAVNSTGGSLTFNHADYNHRYGIKVSGTVTDGGRNEASHNHVAQCLGITCR